MGNEFPNQQSLREKAVESLKDIDEPTVFEPVSFVTEDELSTLSDLLIEIVNHIGHTLNIEQASRAMEFYKTLESRANPNADVVDLQAQGEDMGGGQTLIRLIFPGSPES